MKTQRVLIVACTLSIIFYIDPDLWTGVSAIFFLIATFVMMLIEDK